MSPRSASFASTAVVTPPAVSVKMPVVSASSRMPSTISSSVTESIEPLGPARDVEREHAVGRVPDRQRLGDRVRPHRAADLVPGVEGLGDRAAALGLRAVEGGQRALQDAQLEPLLEARARSS